MEIFGESNEIHDEMTRNKEDQRKMVLKSKDIQSKIIDYESSLIEKGG